MKLLAALLFWFAIPGLAQETPVQLPEPRRPGSWDAAKVEHLWNRAAFGATTQEIERWVPLGPEALVDRLLGGAGPDSEFEVKVYRVDRDLWNRSTNDEQIEMNRTAVHIHKGYISAYVQWWIQEMLTGPDPLRERMTLILHDWLVSSFDKVDASDYCINQSKLFRAHALGNYGELLRQVLRDPAMLVYLDNISNHKRKPNENLARELLELFALGEGNYSEKDIQQAARALTGFTVRHEAFYFAVDMHDSEFKSVLGVSNRMAADELVGVLLDQEACARYVAGRLIMEFEGLEPAEARLQEYARFLRENGYEFRPFLRRLFLDEAFYREEVLGTKVLSPIEYLVGGARRIQSNASPRLLELASGSLGQNLLHPPSVKGWDDGMAWITESSLMMRSNIWGVALREVDMVALKASIDEAIEMMDTMMGDNPMGAEGRERSRGGPLARFLADASKEDLFVKLPIQAWIEGPAGRTDATLASFLLEEILAIPVPENTERRLREILAEGRKELGIPPGKYRNQLEKSEILIRRMVHWILSLPEAHLG
ncbi:MAG: DUF1800 domain-containing protein [Planctomycetota bacterium]